MTTIETIRERPPRRVVMALKVEPWVKETLVSIAERKGITLSDLLRQLLNAA